MASITFTATPSVLFLIMIKRIAKIPSEYRIMCSGQRERLYSSNRLRNSSVVKGMVAILLLKDKS